VACRGSRLDVATPATEGSEAPLRSAPSSTPLSSGVGAQTARRRCRGSSWSPACRVPRFVSSILATSRAATMHRLVPMILSSMLPACGGSADDVASRLHSFRQSARHRAPGPWAPIVPCSCHQCCQLV